MTDHKPAQPCLPGCQPPYHSMMCDNEGYAPGYIAPVSVPGSADQVWDNTTICFGNDCPNCEREKREAKPAPKAPKELHSGSDECSISGHEWSHATGGPRPECKRCGKGKPAPTVEPASVTPASDEEVASVEPNIAKTAWETCSNCDAGLRSINVPPYLEGTHEDYCILTMWPKVIARIEHERAANAELRAGQAAFVEMNAVFEAVMRAIRGEPLSEFDLSHGAVYEAQMLREANNAHARITADLRARLAEVSEAAKELLRYNNGIGRRCSDPHIRSLEAILAKGDTK